MTNSTQVIITLDPLLYHPQTHFISKNEPRNLVKSKGSFVQRRELKSQLLCWPHLYYTWIWNWFCITHYNWQSHKTNTRKWSGVVRGKQVYKLEELKLRYKRGLVGKRLVWAIIKLNEMKKGSSLRPFFMVQLALELPWALEISF